ncbi:MAG TPA: tetratricopeptide repeat protein [Bryobacteraceae bacterium]|nr:tetratricopeptide repeat protein [Bryobacteraceae bacterium]
MLTAVLLLVLAVGAAYHNSLAGPFILDDETSIAQNPTIRDWRTALLPPHDGSASGGRTVSGRPLVNLSFALNYAAGNFAVHGYHVANLLIHLSATLVLFGVVRRTLLQPAFAARYGGKATPLAFVVALLWALHPLQTGAVDYIVQRAESLMALCYLLTLYAFIRGVEQSKSRLWPILTVIACLSGMATKEVMVSAPLMVLLYDRTFVTGSFAQAWGARRRLYVALGGTWLVLAGLVLGSSTRGGTAGFGIGIRGWDYALTQFPAIAHYLRLAVWPSPLVLDYGGSLASPGALRVAAAAILIFGLLAWTAVGLCRRSAAGFLGSWFFAILAPSSSIIPLADTMFEHRMYLPLAAVIALAALALERLLEKRAVIALAVLAAGFGLLTAHRNEDYRSVISIWRDTVAKRPDNARAHNVLGTVLLMQGRAAEAVTELGQALQLKPNDALAHNNLGVALVQLGRVDEALVHYADAVRLDPRDGEFSHNFGDALLLAGRMEEAETQYAQALRSRPDYADAQNNNLGGALLQRGQTARAIALFEAALRARPEFAEAHSNLGNALAQTGRLAEAISHYEAALRLQPNDAETHFNLGNALFQSNRLKDAMVHYDAALRSKPDFAEAHANLGSALLQTGRREEAIRQYRAALRIDPGLADARENLARLGEEPSAASEPRSQR